MSGANSVSAGKGKSQRRREQNAPPADKAGRLKLVNTDASMAQRTEFGTI